MRTALQVGRLRVRFPIRSFEIFHWLNPSGRNMATRVDSASNKNEYQVSSLEWRRGLGWKPYHRHVPIFWKSWEPQPPGAPDSFHLTTQLEVPQRQLYCLLRENYIVDMRHLSLPKQRFWQFPSYGTWCVVGSQVPDVSKLPSTTLHDKVSYLHGLDPPPFCWGPRTVTSLYSNGTQFKPQI
jgi:hypothetical protein